SANGVIKRWALPISGASNFEHLFTFPGGVQGGSLGGMTLDFERRVLYASHSTGNSSGSLVELSWDGSVSRILKSWSNGAFGAQEAMPDIAYCPKDDFIYCLWTTHSGE